MTAKTTEAKVDTLIAEVARMKDAILQLAFTLQQLSKDMQADQEAG